MRWTHMVAVIGGLAALILVGWGLAQVGRSVLPGVWLIQLDGGVTSFFSARRTLALTQVMIAFTTLGDLWLVALLVVALGLAHRVRHGRWRGLWVPSAAGAGAFAVSMVVKLSTGRSRPPDPYAVIDAAGSAFPSGHSIRAMAVYGAIAWLAAAVAGGPVRRSLIWAGAAVVVLGIGLSRVYLGAHWMTDVLVGYALGALWLWLVVAVASITHPMAPDAVASEPAAPTPGASPAPR